MIDRTWHLTDMAHQRGIFFEPRELNQSGQTAVMSIYDVCIQRVVREYGVLPYLPVLLPQALYDIAVALWTHCFNPKEDEINLWKFSDGLTATIRQPHWVEYVDDKYVLYTIYNGRVLRAQSSIPLDHKDWKEKYNDALELAYVMAERRPSAGAKNLLQQNAVHARRRKK